MKNKIIAMMLIVIMMVLIPIEQVSATTMSETERDAYAAEIIGGYLRANCVEIEDCYLSQAYPVYDVKDSTISHYIYFVLKANEVIGRLSVYEEENQYLSNYVLDDMDGINTRIPFQLILVEDNLLLRTSNETFFVAGENEEVVVTDEFYFTGQQLEREEKINNVIQSRSTITHYYLQVPFVANTAERDTGAGLCWAACIASRVNYQKGKSLTAQNVYDACNASGTNRPLGTPAGNKTWIPYGYSVYGIAISYVKGGRNFAQICNLLSNDIPIHCGFQSSDSNHGVLLIGVYQEGTNTVYMYRDPNEPNGVISISVSTAALQDPSLITYSNGSQTYSTWGRTFY